MLLCRINDNIILKSVDVICKEKFQTTIVLFFNEVPPIVRGIDIAQRSTLAHPLFPPLRKPSNNKDVTEAPPEPTRRLMVADVACWLVLVVWLSCCVMSSPGEEEGDLKNDGGSYRRPSPPLYIICAFFMLERGFCPRRISLTYYYTVNCEVWDLYYSKLAFNSFNDALLWHCNKSNCSTY